LTELSASASSETDSGGGGGDLRGSILGPALVLGGCAAGQESVAGFVTALKDIDGVTRVGVQSSELPDREEGAGGSEGAAESEGGGGDCQTRDFIAKFNLVVAFDAAPVPITAEGEVPATATETAQTTSSATESGEAGSAEGE
jgi:hypothetical protein